MAQNKAPMRLTISTLASGSFWDADTLQQFGAPPLGTQHMVIPGILCNATVIVDPST